MTSNLSRRRWLQAMASLPIAAMGGPLVATTPAAASQSESLEQQIETLIRGIRRSGGIAKNERTAWSVYDFRAGEKLVSINENTPYQTASMLKPFVAQAYFFQHRANPRRYPYDETIKRLMVRMIRDSSNPATNELIRRCRAQRSGKPKHVEQILKRHAGGIFRELSLVEFIPRNGRSYRNRASARDYSRFLYALWNQRLPFAADIKFYMALPNGDRLCIGVPEIPDWTEVYDKTGSTARLCGNMGIIVGRDKAGGEYPYTLIGIIEKSRRASNYTQWIGTRSDVIRQVSALTYRVMQSRYQLV